MGKSNSNQPCKNLEGCQTRANAVTTEPDGRDLSRAITHLWETGDTAGRELTSGLDEERNAYGQHIAAHPAEGLTGSPELDAALGRFRAASQEAVRETSLDMRSLMLGAAALPRCATCPLATPTPEA